MSGFCLVRGRFWSVLSVLITIWAGGAGGVRQCVAVVWFWWAALKAAVAAHLADDWRQAHKFYSTWAASIGAALITVWEVLPDSMRTLLPNWFVTAVAYTALICVVVGRVTRQDLHPKAPPAPPAQPAPQNNGGA